MSQTEVVLKLKWWCFHQNNSGGSFHVDSNLAEIVLIQATSANECEAKAQELFFDSNLNSCECCGDRWYWSIHDGEGTTVPTIYEKTLEEWDGSREYPCGYDYRLHHYDGHVTSVVVGVPLQLSLKEE